MDTTTTLALLGMSQQGLQDRVVQQLCHDLTTEIQIDDEGGPFNTPSKFAQEMERHVKEKIGEAVSAMAEKYVLPDIHKYIEDLVFQETNRWGEKRGEPLSLQEYLAMKAEMYLLEPVDVEGRPKNPDAYGRKLDQTRLTFLVHQHFQFAIEAAMKEAVKNANVMIVQGIVETTKIKLKEIADQLKVTVTTR